MPSGAVAVIDIGSNSIKTLVAQRSDDGKILPVWIRTLDARISAGISRLRPQLSEEGMTRGVDAIRSLLTDIAEHTPTATVLVATSAVREAGNRDAFCARVREATGHDVRILSGEDEANLIGRGLTVDPALGELRDFYLFDLGGGSLECLAFREREIKQAVSLPLGCVRLTEAFVPHPAQPVTAGATRAIIAHTREVIAQSSFTFNLGPTASAVGTGGTVATVRAILGAREGRAFEATSPVVPLAKLRDLHGSLSALSLADRQRIPGLPPARADVFPTALATLIAVAEAGGFTAFQNSVYNLRYGLADVLLPVANRP